MIRKLIRKLNDMKLRNKMILSYIVAVIVPLMLIGFFMVNAYRQMALDNAYEQSNQNVERVKQRTAEALGVPMDLSHRISLDAKLEELANRAYQSHYEITEAYQQYDTFRTYLDFNQEINSIKLYIDNPTLLNNWEFYPLDAVTAQTFWYQSAIQNVGRIGWYYFKESHYFSKDSLSLVRSIYFRAYNKTGVLLIGLDTNYLNSILRQEPFDTILLDEHQVVVASNLPGMLGARLEETDLGEISGLSPGAYEMSVKGERSKVFVEAIMPENSYNQLQIATILPINSIVGDADRIGTIGFTVIAVSFAVSVILISLICMMLTKRFLRLSKQIGKVSIGNFNSVIEVDGHDEIGQISRQFNQMVYSIKNLMEEIRTSQEQQNQLELRQNEIKLKMLASQINPHFLYNALESIRMKAHIRGEKEIAQTVKTLGKLMRKNLEITGRPIALKEELEIVRCYLEIQKFRHDARLAYRIDVEPAANAVELPPLIIQPLVENAVIHGLEGMHQGGMIAVCAALTDGHLQVEVRDNGSGMPSDKLEEIQQAIGDQEAQRIGLHNVQQRLRLTYGQAYGLQIESGVGKGTTIRLRIPMEV
ncbi:sensor histidine kinase [Xylanibacillus composti]|uniref:histidine kinase n=1 Tax=Xylanibacillus composti TaxID=1572762 RepID=A0A8J4M3Z7_9BACL|nr:sensor histidine kinase [Xylanibacillus composti]MDT9726153.1 sensor histidine kinase [Xylanibacillus composti]GIQ70612.1 hypothetical protein XYCOK13_34360 [Xylanibacillus composti]